MHGYSIVSLGCLPLPQGVLPVVGPAKLHQLLSLHRCTLKPRARRLGLCFFVWYKLKPLNLAADRSLLPHAMAKPFRDTRRDPHPRYRPRYTRYLLTYERIK